MNGGIRNVRERLRQTLCFEGGGLLLVAPIYALLAGARMRDSFALIAVLTLLVMGWSALFNTAFDVVEHRLSGRLASQRPQWLRVLHALLHEASATAITWPTIVAMTGLSWSAALVSDLGLTLAYALYAYVFHLVYDACRPLRVVQPGVTESPAVRLESCLWRFGSQGLSRQRLRRQRVERVAHADVPRRWPGYRVRPRQRGDV